MNQYGAAYLILNKPIFNFIGRVLEQKCELNYIRPMVRKTLHNEESLIICTARLISGIFNRAVWDERDM
jgi:hypothetical protein